MGHLLLSRARRQAVAAGEIHEAHDLAGGELRVGLAALDRHTGIVTDLGAGSGERVPQGGLPRVGVASHRDSHGVYSVSTAMRSAWARRRVSM